MRRLIKGAFQELDDSIELVDFDDAELALSQIPELKPNLITVDMLMPNMNGLQFLEEFRKTDTNTPVVAITADIQKAVRARFNELGVSGFIEKPITFEKLQETLGRFEIV